MILNQNLFLYFVWICIDAYYRTLVIIMWKLLILPGGKQFGLLFSTPCNLLHDINDILCVKFIWTLLYYPNIIVKSVIRSAIISRYSTAGEHFRYLSYKYDLSQTSWSKSSLKSLQYITL